MTNIDTRVQRALDALASPSARSSWMLCDRHPAEDVAFTFVSADLSTSDVTFDELRERSLRMAEGLRRLGVGPGARVASLMGKTPDLVALMLATWRLDAVYVPLFTAFAPQAISMRLEAAGATVVVADAEQRAKLDPGRDMPAEAPWTIVTGDAAARDADVPLSRVTGAPAAERAGSPGCPSGLVHMFTSGTTGAPKGIVHPLAYVADWEVYLHYAIGLTEDDVFWCGADPGWAYGLYTAVIAPLALGRRSLLVAANFSPELTWDVLSRLAVSNFTAAPTVYRALRACEHPVPRDLRLERLSSAGEPLTPEINEWTRSVLGLAVHDHFGQTELGMVLANHHHPDLAAAIKPRSMGRATPGWKMTVLRADEDRPAGPGVLGRVAVDVAASPLMTFSGYEDADSGGRFTADGRWYLTGDAGHVDEDGDFFFSARDDDVIIMAGYRIGPFDVESVLSEHPDVVETAVIGVPDELRGEVVEAFIVLRDGAAPSDELAEQLQRWVKERYAAHAYPRSVRFVGALPKTPSGKIQRAALRRRRQGELQTARA